MCASRASIQTNAHTPFRLVDMADLPVLEFEKIYTISLEDLPEFLERNGLHIKEVRKDLVFILEPKKEEKTC